ncbi:hypothetical protein SDRG_01713 [Saprolegnia diclina VS20]|uniref:Amino acid transporter transmembrane domain-containing protein n=1 Tax=Saprolegnia diclina (strain VS20) TaxID=1156394 RepID=T0R102_SAPDV|nr:hypothetical protein SDRG_01713 [Saprolegnia diclina VS20]EQC40631.1 hypothetical protein SDRG_01713 [Saprolegnia diclina VS20]|eukprot:XP_008605475.1 hypothetical protein SDRG_01713 [Saprolegnia diclina VS20]
MYTKMNYFRRLQQDWVRVSPPTKPSPTHGMYPPPHVLPAAVFARGDAKEGFQTVHEAPPHRYQSGWSTVFSIWNTMIGSTLVALPYGFSCSGIILGIGIVLLMGVICCHACNLVVTYGKDFSDFGDLTQYHFGRRVQLFAMTVSLLVLVGACIAYHVLMKQCAYAVFSALLHWSGRSDLAAHWTPSAAALLVLLLFPVTNLKHFSTLVFLNSLGIPFVLFTIVFIVYQGVDTVVTGRLDDDIVFGGKSTFGILGGIVTLSFFIHNAIQPIVRHCDPSQRQRHVTTAYTLVGLSYTAVGALGYIGFPHGHIHQNFLDAFPITDVFAFSARASLLLQLATVYPLVLLIVRTQLFHLVFHTAWPGLLPVVGLNVIVMTVTTLFAIYYPNFGDVLRFTGAIGGFVLIFGVPIGIHLNARVAKRHLTKRSLVVYGAMGWIGLGLLVLQFVPMQQ